MARLELLEATAQGDLLPPCCVITGSTEHVAFRRIAVPCRGGGWIRLSLPFNEMACKRWRVSWVLFGLAVFLALFLILASLAVAGFCGPVGMVVFLAAVLLPLLTYHYIVKGSGPEVEHARRGALILRIPSETAARTLQPAIDELEYTLGTLRRAAPPARPGVPRVPPRPAIPQKPK
jgi:hypothetical protein